MKPPYKRKETFLAAWQCRAEMYNQVHDEVDSPTA